jgi:hypothetical protein
VDNLDSKIFRNQYLEVEWFHQAYAFHPECLTAEEVWDKLNIEQKQKIVADFELIHMDADLPTRNSD